MASDPKLITIGAYGFSENEFFLALKDARIDVFCDIRMRRGMRGSLFAFANASRLARRLREMGIEYRHVKGLAPDQQIRQLQRAADKLLGVTKRERATLGPEFIRAYMESRLAHFDSKAFLESMGDDVRVIALFCVEREASACHRSLVAQRLADDLGLEVQHISPP